MNAVELFAVVRDNKRVKDNFAYYIVLSAENNGETTLLLFVFSKYTLHPSMEVLPLYTPCLTIS